MFSWLKFNDAHVKMHAHGPGSAAATRLLLFPQRATWVTQTIAGQVARTERRFRLYYSCAYGLA